MAATTTPADYRKGKTKLVTLSSAHVFLIRKMTVPAMMDLVKVLNINVAPGTPIDQVEELMKKKMDDPQFKEDMITAIDLILPRCIVSPKVIKEGTAGENELSIEEIEPADLLELFQNVVEFSDLSKLAEKFRKQSNG